MATMLWLTEWLWNWWWKVLTDNRDYCNTNRSFTTYDISLLHTNNEPGHGSYVPSRESLLFTETPGRVPESPEYSFLGPVLGLFLLLGILKGQVEPQTGWLQPEFWRVQSSCTWWLRVGLLRNHLNDDAIIAGCMLGNCAIWYYSTSLLQTWNLIL